MTPGGLLVCIESAFVMTEEPRRKMFATLTRMLVRVVLSGNFLCQTLGTTSSALEGVETATLALMIFALLVVV